MRAGGRVDAAVAGLGDGQRAGGAGDRLEGGGGGHGRRPATALPHRHRAAALRPAAGALPARETVAVGDAGHLRRQLAPAGDGAAPRDRAAGGRVGGDGKGADVRHGHPDLHRVLVAGRGVPVAVGHGVRVGNRPNEATEPGPAREGALGGVEGEPGRETAELVGQGPVAAGGGGQRVAAALTEREPVAGRLPGELRRRVLLELHADGLVGVDEQIAGPVTRRPGGTGTTPGGLVAGIRLGRDLHRVTGGNRQFTGRRPVTGDAFQHAGRAARAGLTGSAADESEVIQHDIAGAGGADLHGWMSRRHEDVARSALSAIVDRAEPDGVLLPVLEHGDHGGVPLALAHRHLDGLPELRPGWRVRIGVDLVLVAGDGVAVGGGLPAVVLPCALRLLPLDMDRLRAADGVADKDRRLHAAGRIAGRDRGRIRRGRTLLHADQPGIGTERAVLTTGERPAGVGTATHGEKAEAQIEVLRDERRVLDIEIAPYPRVVLPLRRFLVKVVAARWTARSVGDAVLVLVVLVVHLGDRAELFPHRLPRTLE